jgi:hypothetical protein
MNETFNVQCFFCDRGSEADAAVEAGWIPSFLEGGEDTGYSVCPECCGKHLRLAEDGEWELPESPNPLPPASV